MNVAFQQAFRPFPWLLAGYLAVFGGEAQAAPRGSAAWCQEMMDKPGGMWSTNDHFAFDDGCKAQQRELARRKQRADRAASAAGDQVVHDTEADFERKLNRDTQRFLDSPAGRAAVAAHNRQAEEIRKAHEAELHPTLSPEQQEEIQDAARRAAARARAQRYLDTHGGNAASPASTDAPVGH